MKVALAAIQVPEKPKPSWPWNTSRWRTLRKRILAEEPLCNRCNRKPPKHIHHRVPVSEGGAAFDRDNLVALCVQCHREVTKEHYRLRRALKWQRLLHHF